MKHKKRHQQKKIQPLNSAEISLTFIEHVYELRRRLGYIVGSIILFSMLAYFVQQSIVDFLLRPSKGQQFIYTSPGGGINFLFTVCMYVGIAASMPVIIHHLLEFLRPLIKDQTRSSIHRYVGASVVLGILGFCCGYFIGLPLALHFLSNQFTNKQIHALFTVQEYMTFLTVYLLGSVLLFQLPIILLFINRIKPLTPKRLLGFERYVIVAAFIIAMIMAPTPNIFDQLIIAGPIIAQYNLSILIVGIINRRGQRPDHIVKLLEHDNRLRQSRQVESWIPIPVEPLEVARDISQIKKVQLNTGIAFKVMDVLPPAHHKIRTIS